MTRGDFACFARWLLSGFFIFGKFSVIFFFPCQNNKNVTDHEAEYVSNIQASPRCTEGALVAGSFAPSPVLAPWDTFTVWEKLGIFRIYRIYTQSNEIRSV